MHRSTIALVCLQLLIVCTLTSCARTADLRVGHPAAEPTGTPWQADDLEEAGGPDIAIALPAGAKVVRDIAYARMLRNGWTCICRNTPLRHR
jgi:hypothetical protein